MSPNPNNGILQKQSNHSVEETLDKLKGILQAKAVKIFAVIDHSGEAEKVGLKMPPTKLVIFGNPKAGTPLMLSAPSSAIDLPLKILIWEGNDGKVWVLITARLICSNGTACRKNCCKIYPLSRPWPRRSRSDSI